MNNALHTHCDPVEAPLHWQHWPRHLSHHVAYPATGFTDHLSVNARRYPGRVAVDFYGRQLSYERLWERVECLAGFLRQRCNVQPGDRVLLDMQNSPAFIQSFYAILHADAVVVPVNPMNLCEELDWLASDTGARVALIGQELCERFVPLRNSGRLEHVLVADYRDDLLPICDLPLPDVLRADAHHELAEGFSTLSEALAHAPLTTPPERAGEDLALVLYTSGTTGKPKGCMLSHRALNAQVATQVGWNPCSAESRMLGTAPFFHITGLVASLCAALWLGARLVVMTRWDAPLAVELIRRQRITHWTNIPTMVVDLLNVAGLERADLVSLVVVYGGGTGMPQKIAERWTELTGLEYQEGWGMTEMAAGVHLNPYGGGKRQCLGIPLFDVDTRVIDPDTLLPLGMGERGELVSRSPCLFSGYWNDPTASEEACMELDGQRFFRTGDIGYYDQDGFFFISDRLKRMINVSGYKVWPAEVESIMYEHPDVLQACVIASRRGDRGETVKALVVLREGSTTGEQDIVAWSRTRMAAYKTPRLVECVESLPRSGSGKIQWRQLQDQENSL